MAMTNLARHEPAGMGPLGWHDERFFICEIQVSRDEYFQWLRVEAAKEAAAMRQDRWDLFKSIPVLLIIVTGNAALAYCWYLVGTLVADRLAGC
jgi:hypothetical protein